MGASLLHERGWSNPARFSPAIAAKILVHDSERSRRVAMAWFLASHVESLDGIHLDGQMTRKLLGKAKGAHGYRYPYAHGNPGLSDIARQIRELARGFLNFWCWRRGSNSHDREGRGILSPVRLPVPPLQQVFTL